MDIENIEKGDILEIQDKKYDVVEVWENLKIIKKRDIYYLEISLVEVNRGKILPTHKIEYYYGEDNFYFIDIINNGKTEVKKGEVKKTSP